MKPKLVYVSTIHYIDHVVPILSKLNQSFDLLYMIIFTKGSYYDYSEEFLTNYFTVNNIKSAIYKLRYRNRSLHTLLFSIRIIKEINKNKADIIYFETDISPWLPLAFLFMLKEKDKLIIGIHDFIFHYKENKKLIKYFLSKIIFNKFEKYHFYSRTQEQIFLKSYPLKKTFNTNLPLIDYGDPINKFHFNLDNTKVNILFFGEIRENKGLDILLKEFNMLEENFREKIHITICGSCNNFKNYQKLIIYPENITLRISRVPNEVIPDLFAQHDLVILPYKDITQSGVLLITLNYSLPAICSNLDGFKEIKNAEKAFLFFDPNIKGDLSRVLRETTIQGKEYIKELKKQIKDNVRDYYQPSQISKIMIDNFKKIISNAR